MSLLVEALEKKTQEEAAPLRRQADAVFGSAEGSRKPPGRRLLPLFLLAGIIVVGAVGLGGYLYLDLGDRSSLVPAPPPTASITPGEGSATPRPSPDEVAAQAATEPLALATNPPDRSGATRLAANAQPAQPEKTVSAPRARPPRNTATAAKAASKSAARANPVAASHPFELESKPWQLAQQAEQRGDLPAAARHYAEAIRLEPLDRAAALGRARALAQLGDVAGAESLYESLLARDSRDADALAGLALLRGGSDPSGWQARLEAALEMRPDHAGLHAALGVLLADRSEWRAAAQAFARAARLTPKAEFFYNQALCLDRAGQLAEALTSYRQALQAGRSAVAFDREAVQARIDELTRQP
ncbi:MAG: tetratricopeptide repeat protein [Rhodocyclaceae bacterium]